MQQSANTEFKITYNLTDPTVSTLKPQIMKQFYTTFSQSFNAVIGFIKELPGAVQR